MKKSTESLLGDSGLGGVICLSSGFLLLEVLGEELLVGDVSFFTLNPSFLLFSLHDSLSSDSLLGDESLYGWCFVESLVSSLDLSSDNVLGDIVLLSKSECLSDVLGSLWSESSWSGLIGESWNVSLSLDENSKGNNGKIWAADASSA